MLLARRSLWESQAPPPPFIPSPSGVAVIYEFGPGWDLNGSGGRGPRHRFASTIANLINALAVTTGVIFAAAQIRHYGQRRRRDAMLELVRSFQSPSFASAFERVISLPDGATKAQVSELLGADGEVATHVVGLNWESLGVLVFRREVTLDLGRRFFQRPDPAFMAKIVALRL
jgi:hypothetical protein